MNAAPSPSALGDTPSLAVAPSRLQLFTGFLMLGLVSFGGALPHARRVLVDKRRWLGEDDFVELLGLCQFLPGGNVINLSVAVGMRFRGLSGALSAILGLIAGPSLIVVLLGMLYSHTENNRYVHHLFNGLAAAAAGLLVAMAVKIVLPLMPAWRTIAARASHTDREAPADGATSATSATCAASATTPVTASAASDDPGNLDDQATRASTATAVDAPRAATPAPRYNTGALGIALAGFVAIALLRWPLVPVMLILVPLSVALTRWYDGRGRRS